MDKTNAYLEVNSVPDPSGRRRFKLSLHEIYPDRSQTNLNGICYLEQYVEKNMGSVAEMPLCCEFADRNRSVPLGHGETGFRADDNMPLFENSIVVGAFDGAQIEDVEQDGQKHRVLTGTGVLYEQRYPNLVKWLTAHMNDSEPIRGSVEFVGLAENNGLIAYEPGESRTFRVPTEYQYSGYCLLTVPASDESAVLLELNKANNTLNEEEKELDEQTRKEINEAISEGITTAFGTMRSVEDELRAENARLNGRIADLESEVSTLNATIAERDTAIENMNGELNTANEAAQHAQDALNEVNRAEAVRKLDEALGEFDKNQLAAAEAEINAYRADPLAHASELNSIIDKIQAAAYRQMRAAGKAHETNARNGILGFIDPIVKDEDEPNGIDIEDDPAKIFG